MHSHPRALRRPTLPSLPDPPTTGLACTAVLFHPPRPFPCIPAHFQPLGPGSSRDPDIAQINPQPLKLPPTPDSPSPQTSHSSVPGTSSWMGSACQIPGSSHPTQHLSRQYPPQSPSHRDGAKTQFPRVWDSCFLFVCCSLQSAQTTRCLKRVCSRHCIPGWCVLAAQQLGVPCDTEQVKDSQAHSLPNVLRSRGSISGNPSSPKTAPK